MICGVFGGLAGWFYSRSRHYKKKWKDSDDKNANLCQKILDANGKISTLKCLYDETKGNYERRGEVIDALDHLLCSGYRNLKATERQYHLHGQEPQGVITVEGQDTIDSDLCFEIKHFLFNPNDPEDREFAIREAEELIETIQKA